MRGSILAVPASLLLVAAAPAAGVERWSAAGKTAMAITGDIILSPTRLVMAGKSLPLAVAADPRAFATSLDGPRPARMLRVTRPADPALLHGNTLCGAPVRWIAVYRTEAGKTLTMAVFSGIDRPSGEDDKSLCATYRYAR